MAKTDVLARVAADLARGHTQPAIQRLSSLVAVHPTDLDLRRRLAALHRMVGNRVEAGRWSYLDPTASQEEVAAFERAYPSPTRRLAALRWPNRPSDAATEYARRRLEALVEPAGRGVPLLVPALLTVAAIAAVLIVVGAVTAVQWLL